MKRIVWILLAALLLCACAAKPEPASVETPKIASPAETDVTLTLPLTSRDDVVRSLPLYTAGFLSVDGAPLSFSVQSADADVAVGIIGGDGTLWVAGKGVGETKLTVTATDGEAQAQSTVSVKVRDARRILVLILAGALAVALLVLLGKPVKKEPVTEKQPDNKTEKENAHDSGNR